MLRASASEWPLELIAPCHMSALADVTCADVTRAGCVSDGGRAGQLSAINDLGLLLMLRVSASCQE